MILDSFPPYMVFTEAYLQHQLRENATWPKWPMHTTYEKHTLHLRQEYWPSLLQDTPIGTHQCRVQENEKKKANEQNKTFKYIHRHVDHTLLNIHLRFSESSLWQLAWCSNWSSSQRYSAQNGHSNILPPVSLIHITSDKEKWGKQRQEKLVMLAGMLSPWSQTPLLHSMQSVSARGQVQAWVERHLRLWHTQASQKSQIAP